MRALASCVIVPLLAAGTGCRFGENVAEAPVDGAIVDGTGIGDAGDSTADGPVACTPGTDGDGDGIADCDELGDANPFTDPAKFNGLRAIIGAKPEGTGNCDNLDTREEVDAQFAEPVRELSVHAGWSFDNRATRYDDPGYGFAPNWPEAEGERFSLRLRGQVYLTAGSHCFGVDIGATGTGLTNSTNRCAQVWVGVGAPTAALAETGLDAATAGAATGCVDAPADGPYPFDIVYRNFWLLLPRNRLSVTYCAGSACTPTTVLPATMLQVP
jgi:hypothetical protein